MFVDYYGLLEIPSSSSAEEIKQAFKRQAMKWHPDRNPGVDTTNQMQVLNEAKLILLDGEAREKYNLQYFRFKEYQREKEHRRDEQQKKSPDLNATNNDRFSRDENEAKYSYTDFNIDDEVLNRWMFNARRQAVELAKQTIEELRGMTNAGIKAGAKAMGNALVYRLIIGVIALIIIGLSRSCK
jgi:curved DNA-binding protein CbpA